MTKKQNSKQQRNALSVGIKVRAGDKKSISGAEK